MEIKIVFSFDYIDIFLTSISLDKMKVSVLIKNINLKKWDSLIWIKRSQNQYKKTCV